MTARTKRPRVLVENDRYAGAMQRMVKAFGRRCGDGDPTHLAYIIELEGFLDDARTAAVVGLRRQGYSWGEIGRGLKVTRQEAHRRYRKAVGE